MCCFFELLLSIKLYFTQLNIIEFYTDGWKL